MSLKFFSYYRFSEIQQSVKFCLVFEYWLDKQIFIIYQPLFNRLIICKTVNHK